MESDEDSDDERISPKMKNMSNQTAPEDYMREELREMLQNSSNSRKSKEGSAPKGNGKPLHKTSESEEISSGSDDSDSSSTSDEEEDSECIKQKSSIMGSAPQGNSKPQQNTPEGEESSSDKDSSSHSSTFSEEEDSGAAAAPSG